MNRTLRMAVIGLVVLAAAFGGGWYYGSPDRREVLRHTQIADIDYPLMEARSHLLEGRVELYNNNFGNAARAFDAAKRSLVTAAGALEKASARDDATLVQQAMASADTAIQRAGRLEPTAHDVASSALKAVDDAIARRGR